MNTGLKYHLQLHWKLKLFEINLDKMCANLIPGKLQNVAERS